ERKVVTVLVAEVVPASHTDLEDLEAVVQPAVGQVRDVIERHGGTAERLFANAVLGLFRAPRAHDDDALPAVRTALALAAVAPASGVRIRGGIDTGEALVTIDADDHVAVTGAVLATASNLQATAPAGTIVVGAAAHRATEGFVDYGDAGAGAWTPEA